MPSTSTIRLDWVEPTLTDGPSDAKEIATYNWHPSSTTEVPRMVVPGLPPFLVDSRDPPKLEYDQGTFFCDENQYRQKESPTESLFQAVAICTPNFDWQAVDIVTDRNNLRKLMRALQPQWDSFDDQSFQVDLDVVGRTVVLTRVGPAESQVFGCGHSFEDQMTTPSPEGSFRRVVSLNLGRVALVVRSEIDAVDGGTWRSVSRKAEWSPKPGSRIEIKRGGGLKKGSECPEYWELKTKSLKKRFDWAGAYGQLCLGDVHNLLIARTKWTEVKSMESLTREQVGARGRFFDLFGRLEALLMSILETVRKPADGSHSRSYVVTWDGWEPVLEIKPQRASRAGTLSLTVESLEIIGPFECVLFKLSNDFCVHGQSVLNVTYDGWEPVTVAYAYGQVVSPGEELDWATLSFPKFRVPPGMRGMITVHSFLVVSHRKAYIRQIRGHANASHKFGPFFGRLPPVLDEYRVLGTETVLGPDNLSWSPIP
ncbi:hypothetical protein FOZ61_004577 [Perkinsus olseni]|uniref:Uncharacterized protein n=1 Tax=Perkinsus olseni TaxID=32597 RepID=A0A7J6MD14_PEROL|nr:hypothetical protein FOZ61_004577 [Perkinsus olseni]